MLERIAEANRQSARSCYTAEAHGEAMIHLFEEVARAR
jgi:hypothetical protein